MSYKNSLFFTCLSLATLGSLHATNEQASADAPKKVYIKLEWGFGYWPRVELEKALNDRGYIVEEVRSLAGLHDASFIITYDVPRRDLYFLRQYDPAKCILVAWEPPIVKSYNYQPEYHALYSKVLTWNGSLVDNQKYFKCFYTVHRSMIEDVPAFDEKKFCVLINRQNESSHPSSLLAKRMDAIHFFERQAPHQFDLFGDGWDARWRVTRGPIGGNDKFNDKIEVMKNYKFCICYENSREQGYVTEKIFDCFRAGCIPIYWGAPDVTDHIPTSCFIDAQSFSSFSELYNHISKITKEEYEAYLTNIRSFLKTDAAHFFSNEQYVKTLMHVMFGEPL